MQIKFHDKFPAEEESKITMAFDEFEMLYGPAIEKEKDLPMGPVVFPNHACIFNKVHMIGTPAMVIATNDRFCILQFINGHAEFYRCEDVDTEPVSFVGG